MLARFYNVGATLRELAEMLLHLTGRRRPISYAPRSQATLVRHRVGSTLRAAREIAFTARIALPTASGA